MQTLDCELHQLSSAAGDLVSEECITGVGHAVRGVPSALTRYFGFECPLGTTRPVADFYLRVSGHGERSILAGASAEHMLPERLSGRPVWRQLRRFCEDWIDPASPMAAELRQIWLEFDVSATRVVDAAVPSVFIMIERRGADGNADGRCYRPDVERSLALLGGAELPPAVLRTVRICLESAPDSANLSFFLGLMLGRQTDSVRVCVRNLSAEQIPAYLEAIQWRGPLTEACDALLPFAQRSERLTLDLDAGETVGPKLGLECGFRGAGGTAAVTDLVDALVTRDLCVPAKRDALIGWAGRIFEREDAPVPPEHLSGALWLSGLWASAVLVGRVNHVKINFESGRRLHAKAYVALDRRWHIYVDGPAAGKSPHPTSARTVPDRDEVGILNI
jgi:hypothetical protein